MSLIDVNKEPLDKKNGDCLPLYGYYVLVSSVPLKKHMLSFDPEKGFHIGTVVSCILGIFANSVVNCMILPCLPFLVKMYFPDMDVADYGYYSGNLLSFFYLGQIPGCIFWGWYADRYGRRNAMIIITILNFFCIFAFGISTNYYVSLAIRLIHGLVDGSLGVTKTIMAELSNDRNISFGTSLIFVGTAFGRLFGPSLGGYLSRAENIKFLVDMFPILKKMSFLVPFSISSLLFLFVLVSFVFFAVETISQDEIENAKVIKEDMKREMSSILRKSSSKGFSSHEQLLIQYNNNSSYLSFLKDKDILFAVVIYGIHCLNQMAFDSLFPLVMVNRREYGGFEMGIVEVGLMQTIASPMALSTVLICPIVSRFCSYRTQMVSLTILVSICMVLYPIESLFVNSSQTTIYAVTFVFYCIYIVVRSITFNVTIVLIANVAYKEFRATTMGIAQTIGGLGRFIGPTIFTMLYAWSCHKTKFPIHHGLSYYALGIVVALCVIIPFYLSDACNKGRGSITSTIVHQDKTSTVIVTDSEEDKDLLI